MLNPIHIFKVSYLKQLVSSFACVKNLVQCTMIIVKILALFLHHLKKIKIKLPQTVKYHTQMMNQVELALVRF